MSSIDALVQAFTQAMQKMEARREEFNQADSVNGNHGEHMVQIFQAAAQAVQGDDDLSEAMRRAADRLAGLGGNGSAQVYAQGLYAFAQQFRQRGLNVEDLMLYLQQTLNKGEEGRPQESMPRAGDLLKALMGGLAEWKQAADQTAAGTNTGEAGAGGLDMAFLLELGAAYMSAKNQGGSRSEVVSDAAVRASPLSQVAHRAQSGKAAVQAVLESLASGREERF